MTKCKALTGLAVKGLTITQAAKQTTELPKATMVIRQSYFGQHLQLTTVQSMRY